MLAGHAASSKAVEDLASAKVQFEEASHVLKMQEEHIIITIMEHCRIYGRAM